MRLDDLEAYFRWLDGVLWRGILVVLLLGALAIGAVLLWRWSSC